MFQVRSAPSEHQNRSAATPRSSSPSVLICPLASPHRVVGWPVSYLSCSKRARQRCLALRNFDTEPRSSHCYEIRSDNRLESVANAHTAADLHVRPVSQTALVSRAVGAANGLRNTRCTASRNQFDSTRAVCMHASRRAVIVILESKFLNQREESRASGAVTNLGMAAKIFNKFFTIDCRESGFSKRLESLWR
jgi:hypothetical protein